jgi:hypothetical protein
MKKFNPKEFKKACDQAMISYTIAYLIFKGIKKLVIITCMLFICMISFSQEFSKINYLDSTKTQVANFTKDQGWCRCSNKWEGEPADLYTSSDYQTVIFIFNPIGKCRKIIIRNPITKPVYFAENIIFTGVLDDQGNIIYTIEK